MGSVPAKVAALRKKDEPYEEVVIVKGDTCYAGTPPTPRKEALVEPTVISIYPPMPRSMIKGKKEGDVPSPKATEKEDNDKTVRGDTKLDGEEKPEKNGQEHPADDALEPLTVEIELSYEIEHPDDPTAIEDVQRKLQRKLSTITLY